MRWIYRREAATLRPFESLVTRAAETTLVINNRERDALLDIEPSGRVRVIESGVDLDAFRPAGPPEPSATVVFCGVLNYAPNRDGILWFVQQVWPIVRASRTDAKLLIVGANPPPEILALGQQDASIEVAGSVPEVQPYLWRSSVAIAPLQVARGIQNKVLEALAAGLPTVVTPEVAGGLPDEAQSGCLVARDQTEFAGAVLRLLALSPQKRRDLADQASIERLTWGHRLSAIEGVLRGAQRRPAAS
jgi:glycosyltransferase involved in cell wall biosynthesis